VNETFFRPLADLLQSPSTTPDSALTDETVHGDVPLPGDVVSAAAAVLIPLPDRFVPPGICPLSSLAVQQHGNFSVSVPHSGLSDLADAHPKSGSWIFVSAISECPSIQPGYSSCTPLAHPVAAMQVLDHLPTP